MCNHHGAAAPLHPHHTETVELMLEDRSEFRQAGEVLAGDLVIARAQFRAAVAVIARQAPDPEVRSVASAVLDYPTSANLAKLRDLSHRTPWETSLLDGLSTLAIAGIGSLIDGGGH